MSLEEGATCCTHRHGRPLACGVSQTPHFVLKGEKQESFSCLFSVHKEIPEDNGNRVTVSPHGMWVGRGLSGGDFTIDSALELGECSHTVFNICLSDVCWVSQLLLSTMPERAQSLHLPAPCLRVLHRQQPCHFDIKHCE